MSASGRCNRISVGTSEPRRWPISVKYGCAAHTNACSRPTPRSPASPPSPMNGASPTSAASPRRTRHAMTSPRRRHCGAELLGELYQILFARKVAVAARVTARREASPSHSFENMKNSGDSTYILGHDAVEVERLLLQGRIWHDHTE